MNEYIEELKEILISNNFDDASEIVSEYQEYIIEKSKNKDMSLVLKELGTPKDIALEYINISSTTLKDRISKIDVNNIYLTIYYQNSDDIVVDTNLSKEDLIVKDNVLSANVDTNFITNLIGKKPYLKIILPYKLDKLVARCSVVKIKNTDIKDFKADRSVVTLSNCSFSSANLSYCSIKITDINLDIVNVEARFSEIKLNNVNILKLLGVFVGSVIRYKDSKIQSKYVDCTDSKL